LIVLPYPVRNISADELERRAVVLAEVDERLRQRASI
jgi:hypothetical protein